MKLLLNIVSHLVLCAVALIAVHFWVSGVTLNVVGFLVALVVFTLAQALFTPIVLSLAARYANGLLGGIGLVSTVLALFIATLFPGGLEIAGLQAWLLAPLVVWLITALGGWIVTTFVLKRWLQRREQDKIARRSAAKS